MSSELPIGYESLRTERDRLESLLQTSEDWRALVQLRARKTRGEGLSEVNSDRLELMLRDALAENPAYGRFMAVCATMDRALGGKPRPPVAEASSAAQSSGDDLTRIRGIDATMARRLRALDVLSFEQIANWRSTDIQKISDVLSLGRVINSQNWIEQAAMLMPASARASKPVEVRNAVPAAQAAPAAPVRIVDAAPKPAAHSIVQDKPVDAKQSQQAPIKTVASPTTETVVPANQPAKPEPQPEIASIGAVPQSDYSFENVQPPRPLQPVHYRIAPALQKADDRKQSSELSVSKPQITQSATVEAARPNTVSADASKQAPPRPLVVQQGAMLPPMPVVAPKAPTSAPSPLPTANKAAVAPPPIPNSAPLVSGRASEIKPPADAVAWALDRALEAIKNSKQTTSSTLTPSPGATAAMPAEKISKPTPPPASKPPASAPAVLRNGTQPPPLPPSVWQLAESVQPAAVQGAVVVPRSYGGSANGRIDRDELAQSQISVEEASVEIVRRPPASANPPLPPTQVPVFASSEPIAELPKPENRATKPLGRFLKALTGNS